MDGRTDGRTTYERNTALALRASRGKKAQLSYLKTPETTLLQLHQHLNNDFTDPVLTKQCDKNFNMCLKLRRIHCSLPQGTNEYTRTEQEQGGNGLRPNMP